LHRSPPLVESPWHLSVFSPLPEYPAYKMQRQASIVVTMTIHQGHPSLKHGRWCDGALLDQEAG
ncbi:MAG: hypothetical protein ACREP0_13530, partial [Rhodanobacteraceae bacterium]